MKESNLEFILISVVFYYFHEKYDSFISMDLKAILKDFYIK
jgi:hypothetical protein